MAELATQSTEESMAQSTAQSTAQSMTQSTEPTILEQTNSSDIQKNMSELYKNGLDIVSNLLNDLKTLNIQNIIGKFKKVLNAYENLDTEKKFTYAVGSFLLMMVLGILTDILFSVSYIAYPIYATMKAIKVKSEDNIPILTKWSIYWIMYSLFNFVELYLPLYNHIPYYKYIKLFVLVFGFMDLTDSYNNYSLNLTFHAIKLYEKYNNLFDGIASKFGIKYCNAEDKKD